MTGLGVLCGGKRVSRIPESRREVTLVHIGIIARSDFFLAIFGGFHVFSVGTAIECQSLPCYPGEIFFETDGSNYDMVQ